MKTIELLFAASAVLCGGAAPLPVARAPLWLFIHDRDSCTDKGENGLSLATERGKVCNRNPHLWPEFILKE